MENTPKLELTVTALGGAARRLLARSDQVSIIGLTSKGAFLKTEAGEVCFLTQEGWHGPLTLNLRDKVSLQTHLQVGAKGQYLKWGIEFPACRIVIPEGAEIWEPTPIQMGDADLSQSLVRGAELARRLDTQNSLFKDFFRIIKEHLWLGAEQALLAVVPGGEGGLRDQLPALLGLGGGLTPSGDDFICGWLLARFYLNENLPVPGEGVGFVSEINSQARAQTTALSASLIACAAEGQADERLMQALVWLLTGKGEVEKIKEALLTYGSASGSDALAGMLASLLFFQESPGD